MKSAFEIAMARLEKESGPTPKLDEEQRAKLADIDKRFDAKLAETKLSYEERINNAATVQELEALRAEQTAALSAIESDREKSKQPIWDAAT